MHMHFDGFDDGKWDEFKWETHLNEVEKKSEQLRKFITSDPKGNTPRWLTLLKESQSENDAFEAYVEEELLMDEAYFPEEEDDWDEEEDDWDDEDFLFGFSEEGLPDSDEEDDVDEFDRGEEWKSLSDEYRHSDYGTLDNLQEYFSAKELAVDILKWAETVPAREQSKEFQEFVDEILKIGAKLAGGHSFGFEQEYIGANIAYSKKALASANHALILIQQLKKKSLFQKKNYLTIHSELFELRNDIGIYIQELRDQFRLGLE